MYIGSEVIYPYFLCPWVLAGRFIVKEYYISLNADLPSMYTPPAFSGPIPEVSGEFLEVYTGGCYCGAVTLMVKTKPLPEIEVKEDNCSICQRVCLSLLDYLSLTKKEHFSKY